MSRQVILILALCCATLLSAQSIETYVSNDTILLGNDVLIKITYNNIEGSSHTTPEFNNLKIISGPNTSSSVSIINGAKTSKKTYTYYLRPQKEGNIEIPPLSAEHEGATIYSDTLRLTVAPNPDNVIIIPEDDSQQGLGSNFFEFRQFPFGQREIPKKKEDTKSKRKYKRI